MLPCETTLTKIKQIHPQKMIKVIKNSRSITIFNNGSDFFHFNQLKMQHFLRVFPTAALKQPVKARQHTESVSQQQHWTSTYLALFHSPGLMLFINTKTTP